MKHALYLFLLCLSYSICYSQSYGFQKRAFHIGYNKMQFLNDEFAANKNTGSITGGNGIVFGFEHESTTHNISLVYAFNWFQLLQVPSSRTHNHNISLNLDLNVFRQHTRIRPYIGVGFGANFLRLMDKDPLINSQKNIYMPLWRAGVNFRVHPGIAIVVRYSQSLPSGVSFLDGELAFQRKRFAYSTFQIAIVGGPIFTKNY